jgi:hypothetical protein
VSTRVIPIYILDMIELQLDLGLNKYDTWRIFLVNCFIDNFVRLRSYIRNVNSVVRRILISGCRSKMMVGFEFYSSS